MIETKTMLTEAVREYVADLKTKRIDEITREMVEKGINLFQEELLNDIKESNSLLVTPQDFDEIKSSLNTLESRELLALTGSYFSSSRQRHVENMGSISKMRDELINYFTKFTVQASESRVSNKVEKIQKANNEIHRQVVKGLVQLEGGLSDLRYLNLMRFNAVGEKTTSREIDQMHQEMILAASKNDTARYIGALTVYVSQVKEALSKAKGLSKMSSTLQNILRNLDELTDEMSLKLQKYSELFNKELNTQELMKIVDEMADMHQELDQRIKPVSEMIKNNMLTEKTGSFLLDYAYYDQPKAVIDKLGDEIEDMGTQKSKIQNQAIRNKDLHQPSEGQRLKSSSENKRPTPFLIADSPYNPDANILEKVRKDQKEEDKSKVKVKRKPHKGSIG